MLHDENSPIHSHELWNESNFLKMGALSLTAGGLFEANAIVHIYESGLTNAPGVFALVLGGLAFKAASGAFSEATKLRQNAEQIAPPNFEEF